LLTAILAVLKAGGAYLPLDPKHPAPRVAQVLEQSRTPLVLAEADLLATALEARDLLPESSPRPRLLDLDQLFPAGETPEGDGAGVSHHAGAESGDAWRHALAYVIFTSGSTGTPKGVMVHQEGMLNHLWANIEVLEMGPEDVLAQTASQCFDISVWQFLAPLMLGGRVHIFGDEITEDPPRLLGAVDETGVTVFETVPSLLQLMLSELGGRGALPPLEALRWLLPTGEALPPKLLEEWFQVYPEIPLVNAYGPSECSDDVTLEILRQPARVGQGSRQDRVSIGRPVSGLTVHVLDRNLQEVPPGIAGEIVVGGIGVGRGYLHDPARTAGVFLPDPFSAIPGSRMYRSGDLGRHRTDGALEFVGRVDFQVKVRGFRIELGEIEAVLGRHPAVQEVVVVARQEGPGGARLVAYLVAREDRSLDPVEVKEHVGEALPAYMVPGILVELPALPLNANGKVDRSALPVPAAGLLTGDRPYIAPRNADETALAAIFADLLGMERVSVEDDFFDLGGHSLLAIQALSRIRDTFLVEPPLRALFETSTVAGMVEVIQAIRWAAGGGGEEVEEALLEEALVEEEFLL
jgi:amino acid adenylation domain-containing protein